LEAAPPPPPPAPAPPHVGKRKQFTQTLSMVTPKRKKNPTLSTNFFQEPQDFFLLKKTKQIS
jgi:hypothetical protein